MRLHHGLDPSVMKGFYTPAIRPPKYDPVVDLGADLHEMWDARRSDLMTTTANAVSSWRGVKAASDAVQATGASQPIYRATAFGGDPDVRFDGVDDYLTFAAPPWPAGASPLEMWALVDQEVLPADATIRVVASYGSGQSSLNAIKLQRSTGATNRANFQGGNDTVTASSATTNPDCFGRCVMRGEANGTTVRAWCNYIPATASAQTLNTIATRFRMGTLSVTTPIQFWQGSIAVMAVTNLLPPDKATRFMNYLIARRHIQ
jgi:hypothetical protein